MKKRVYTEEFRRQAVRLLRTSGKSARQVADELLSPVFLKRRNHVPI